MMLLARLGTIACRSLWTSNGEMPGEQPNWSPALKRKINLAAHWSVATLSITKIEQRHDTNDDKPFPKLRVYVRHIKFM
jgi:hypothetical protein